MKPRTLAIALAALALTPAPGTAQTFTKVTSGPIVTDGGDSRGATWVDYNADGYDDLFVTNWSERNFLYLNGGNGSFARVLSGPVAQDIDFFAGPAWGDYTNDGYPDLFIANAYTDYLYQNDGAGGFTRITSGPVLGDGFAASVAAAWSDYDVDGDLDLVVTNDNWTNYLYANNGDGSFTRVTTGPVVTDGGNSRGCAWADYDNDGAPDLFITNVYGQRNFLYHNNGDGSFTRITGAPIGTEVAYSVGGSWGDYNNDGNLDLFVSNPSLQANFLYRNNGGGSFTKITSGAIVTDAYDSAGSAWGDYDNDGDLDLFVANWGVNNSLYSNNGNGTFTRVTQGTVVNDGGNSAGAGWADYDNDGDLDLFVANTGGQNNFLYRNNGNANAWLQVRCLAVGSNRGGIGAKVRVRATIGGIPVWQLREVSTQTGSASANSARAAFGLRDASLADSLVVEWPGGTIQVLTAVAPNQILDVVEPASAPTANFYADVTEGLAPLTVRFTSTSTPGGAPITSWRWDFDNDGVIDSQERNPVHVYTSRGLYSITHIVSDGARADTLTLRDYIRVYDPDPLYGRLFYTWRVYKATGPANGVAFAKIDGDNLPDLLTLSGVLPSVVTVRLNRGDGSFGSPTTYGFSTDGSRLEVADLNGDGREDVVVLNGMGNMGVLVRLGTGTGLGPLATYPDLGGGWLQDLALADLNGDGRPDVVYSNWYPGSPRLSSRLNLGNGTFGARQDIALSQFLFSLGADDLNGDGFDDVVATNWSDQTLVFMNNGSGQLQSPISLEHGSGQSVVEVADLNGDLSPEIIVSGTSTRIHWNNGAGLFPTSTTISDPVTASDVEVGDVDGDRRPDLVFNGWDDWAVITYRGGVSFGAVRRYETAATGTQLALGDFDLDGDLDVAQATRTAQGVYVRDNLGGGLFQDNHRFPDLRGYKIRVSDLDLDGDQDLVSTAMERGYVALYNGDGTFAPQQQLYEPPSYWGVHWPAVGRIDNDAYPDIAMTLQEFYGILGFTTFRNQTNGTFGQRANWPIESCGPGESRIVDLDADGYGDVVVANGAGGCPSNPTISRSLSISMNRGDAGGFAPPFLVDSGGQGPFTVAAADVDRDGDQDLLAPVSGASVLSVLLNDGTGRNYAGPFLYGTGERPSNLVVVDLNGDQFPDVATCNAGIPDRDSPPTMNVFLNAADGTGRFLPGTLYPGRSTGPSQDSYYIEAGDADHDGDMDLILPSWNTEDFSVFLNQGNGAFGEAEIYGGGENLEQVAFTDFTGDGCADVILAFGGSIGVARGIPCVSAGVEERPAPGSSGSPGSLVLRAQPNPSAREVSLSYALSVGGEVKVGVYDSSGRLVRSVASGTMPAGAGAVTWDGRNSAGQRVAAGLYYMRFESGKDVRTTKVVRLR